MGIVIVPFTAAFAMIGLLVPLRALDMGASPAIVGVLVATKALAPAILAMPVGSLVDRIGERAPMVAALAVAALATLAAGAATTIGALLVVLLVIGSTHLVFIVASQRLVSSMARGAGSERNFGWYTTFQSAGQMIGPIVAGVVLDAASFAAAFAAAAAASLLATAAVARIRTTSHVSSSGPSEAAERDVRRATTTDRSSSVINDLLANPGFRMAIIVSYAVLLTQSVRQAFLPVYMESLAFSGTLIGVVVSALGLTAVLVRPFMASIVRAFGGRSRTLILMVAAIIAGVTATSLSTTFAGLLVATVLVGIGHGITQPLSMATVGDHVARRHMGFALGVRLTANRVAQLAGPLAIGLLAEVTGVRWTFLMAGALLAVALPVMVAVRPAFDASEHALRHDGNE
jgi:MFS family permease